VREQGVAAIFLKPDGVYRGVIVFSTGEGEKVASVERLAEEGEENGGE
jgi:hypothetical protein